MADQDCGTAFSRLSDRMSTFKSKDKWFIRSRFDSNNRNLVLFWNDAIIYKLNRTLDLRAIRPGTLPTLPCRATNCAEAASCRSWAALRRGHRPFRTFDLDENVALRRLSLWNIIGYLTLKSCQLHGQSDYFTGVMYGRTWISIDCLELQVESR